MFFELNELTKNEEEFNIEYSFFKNSFLMLNIDGIKFDSFSNTFPANLEVGKISRNGY